MWEWEAPPDDEGGGPDPSIAGDIIESQRVDLERRKEQKKIEEQINSIIDDRIAKFKNKIEIDRLSVQELKKQVDIFTSMESKLKRLRIQREQLQNSDEAATESGKKRLKQIQEAEAAATAETEAFQGALTDVGEGMLNISTLSEGAKDKIKAALASGNAKKMQEAIAEAEAEMDNFADATDDVNKGFSFLARTIGMTTNASNTGFGKMVEGVTRFGVAFKKNWQGASMALVSGFASMVSPINLVANMLSIMVDLFKESEEAAADMTKAFGGGQKENMVILQQAKSMALQYNASLKEVSETLNTMEATLVGFNKSMREQHKGLIENSIAMKKLGVDEKLLMTQTNKLRFAFGGSQGDIEKTHKRIVEFAAGSRSLGYTMNESVQMLSQFGGSVSSMGGNITSTLQDMMAMAKATGAEMSQLLSIAKKFNTFKEGADMAAKLNSVFGTSISQIELMGKTAPERNKIIAESLKNATGGYQSMTDHQRLAAAEMLGFGDDVEKLRTFMHGQTDAARKAAEARQKQAENMQQLRQAAMDIVPTLTQLTNAFKDAFVKSGALQNMIQTFTQNKDSIVGSFVMLANAVAFLAKHLRLIISVYGGVKIAMILLGPLFVQMKAQMATGATISTAYSAALQKVGGSAIFARTAIFGFIGGLLIFFATMLMSGSPQLYLIAGVMAGMILVLGAAFLVAGPAMKPTILALALLMGALALVFYMIPPIIDAIAALVVEITNLFTTLIDNLESLGYVALALYAIGGGFLFLGSMALIASLGILAGTAALIALRASMKLSGTSFDDLLSIGEGVSKMGEGMKALKEGISGLGAAGGELMKSLGDKTLMVSGDARGATIVAGKAGMFAFVPPKITVDVNMDDIETAAPIVNVTVKLDADELKHVISEEIASSR